MKKIENKTFWEKQAKKFGKDVKAVNFDPLEEELEHFFLDQIVPNGVKICDLGCGNGRTIAFLSKRKVDSFFVGVDFSENMIKEAKKQNLINTEFLVGDATSSSFINSLIKEYGTFDLVLTKRLLINLFGDHKLKTIYNIYSLLKTHGKYIMIECFVEPLNKINEIRSKLSLREIKVKPFNEYLTQKFINQISHLFAVDTEIDFESTYYFISRIFNAYLSEGEPDYLAPINKLAVKLTKLGYNFLSNLSPEKIYILKKK